MTLDSRRKIVSIAEARDIARELHARGERVIAFVSHMEVLRAAHAVRLDELGPGVLFVVLTDPPSPLVAMDARAEVVAGLRRVDYVVAGAAAVEAIRPTVCIHDEEEDRERTRELINDVRSRGK